MRPVVIWHPPIRQRRRTRGSVMLFFLEDYMPVLMFAALAILLFSGYPVALVLAGVGLGFGFLGVALDFMNLIQLSNIVSRIFGGIVENLVLVAVPMLPCCTMAAQSVIKPSTR